MAVDRHRSATVDHGTEDQRSYVTVPTACRRPGGTRVDSHLEGTDMGTTMLAGRMNFATGTFAVKQVPVPVPGPGEVRVHVRAAGICLSDVHIIERLFPPPTLPGGGDEMTLGHEVSGEVESFGDGVTGVDVGARVIVFPGNELSGQAPWLMGVNRDGGWAEYVVVPADVLVPIPDSLPFEQAAIIPDAVSTAW